MSAVPNLPEQATLIGDALSNESSKSNRVPGLNGQTKHNQPSSFKLHDTPVENFRPIKVIVIGAGYSGIYCGIRIPEKIRNAELVIYEKNEGIGGTWWENKYPGCACDVPSHSYQFSFEPNRDWSSLYAPAREIQAYLERVAKKYSADRFIKLSHEVKECRYDDQQGKWHVTVQNITSGEIIQDTSDVLISARGNLNNPAWPEIEGLKSFKGELMHSAKWNESYDFNHKRIGVIGSGSSAIQIIPSLQRLPGTQLTTFIRSQTWISPSFGQELWDKHNFQGHSIPPEIRDRFHNDPEYYNRFRLAVEEDGNGIHGVTIKGTPIQLGAKAAFEEHMKERLASRPDIFDSLLPSFSPGCKRLTPGPGFLEALTKENVNFVTTPITRITENAVVTADGKAHEIDVLVCATGFATSTAPPFPIIGTSGLSIKERWEERATTYLSLAIDQFPNSFMMLGPNAAIGSGSLTMMIESVGSYIVKCIRKLQKENIKSMMVKRERVEDFTEYVDRYFEGTVFAEQCRSWYRNGAGKGKGGGDGEVVGLWPGSTLHCIEALRSPRWEDFDYIYVGEEGSEEEEMAGVTSSDAISSTEGIGRKRARVDSALAVQGPGSKRKRVNRMAWLGNGWSAKQFEEKDLAWYLYPEFLDQPVAPRPEEKETYRIRPFSH